MIGGCRILKFLTHSAATNWYDDVNIVCCIDSFQTKSRQDWKANNQETNTLSTLRSTAFPGFHRRQRKVSMQH